MRTIMSIWLLERKQAPDDRVTKHKARICAYGGQQQWRVNYWETFSQVVNWLSVRAMLVVTLINNLLARLIDFALAFPQAELDVPVYIKLPSGMSIEEGYLGEYVIELKWLLYGLKQTSYN